MSFGGNGRAAGVCTRDARNTAAGFHGIHPRALQGFRGQRVRLTSTAANFAAATAIRVTRRFGVVTLWRASQARADGLCRRPRAGSSLGACADGLPLFIACGRRSARLGSRTAATLHE